MSSSVTERINLKKELILQLLEKAKESRELAYANYSKFKVGVAILAKSGRIYGGCNIENASYPVGQCAERSAFSNAYMAGDKEPVAWAVVADTNHSGKCWPCGNCRQLMNEADCEK